MSEKNFDELSPTDSVREAMQRMTVRVVYFDSDLNIIATTHVQVGNTPIHIPQDTIPFEEASLVVRFRQCPDRAIEICVLKNRFGEPNGNGNVTVRLRGLK